MGLKRVFGSSSSEKGADVSLSATTCLCIILVRRVRGGCRVGKEVCRAHDNEII